MYPKELMSPYLATYNKQKRGLTILFIYLGIFLINLFKIVIQTEGLKYFDLIFLFGTIICIIRIVDLYSFKMTFSVCHEQLKIVRGNLFYRKTTIYDLEKIEDLEVENMMVIKFPGKKKPAGNAIVTFFYDDKEIALGDSLSEFDANRLFDELTNLRPELLTSFH